MIAARLEGIGWLLAAGAVMAWSTASPAMTLSEAYRLSLQHDPAAAVYQAQYESARENGIIERAGLKPTLSFQGTAAEAHTKTQAVFGAGADRYPTWSVGAEARQPLFRLDWFDVGKRATAFDTQAEVQLRSSQQDLLIRVANRYFNVLVAQDQLMQAEAEALSVSRSLQDTRQRYEVELVPGTDLKEAQAREDLAQARLVAARRALENARDELEESTGIGATAVPSLPPSISFPPLLPADPAAWVAAARDHSPRIAAAEQAAIVARTEYSSLRASALPTLDLVASASRNDSSDYELGQRSEDARIGVELNVPIYAGGAVSAGLRRADAELREAEAELARVKLETERATRQLYRTAESAYLEASAYQKSLASAELAEVATRHGYDAGTRTITDVLDAQSRVVQARRDFNTTRYNLLLSVLQLKQNVGRLGEQDFAAIDALLQDNTESKAGN